MNLSFFNERFQQQTSVNVVSWHPIQLITPVVCKTCRVVCFWNIFYLVFFTYTLQAKNISPSTKEKQIPPPPQSKKIKFFDTPLLAVILYKDKAIGFFLGFYIKNYMHFDITREDKI